MGGIKFLARETARAAIGTLCLMIVGEMFQGALMYRQWLKERDDIEDDGWITTHGL